MKNQETEQMKHVVYEFIMTLALMAVSAVFCLCMIMYDEQILTFFKGILNE